MSYKNLYISIKTSGLNSLDHGIIQIAAIAEIGSEVVGAFNNECRLFTNDKIDSEALKMQRLTESDVRSKLRMSPKGIYRKFIKWLEIFINPLDRNDKFSLHAYNVQHPISFLNEFFSKNGNAYLWYYTDNRPVCVLSLARIMNSWDMEIITDMKSLKFANVCQKFNIKHKRSYAESGVISCMLLYKKLCNHIATEARYHIGGEDA